MDFLNALNIKENNQGVSTGINWIESSGKKIDSFSPVDGTLIGSVTTGDEAAYEQMMEKAEEAFKTWRTWPAPRRAGNG